MRRRTFMKGATGGAAALVLGPGFWRAAFAAPAVPGTGPYGPLLGPDANGLMLPNGFKSRVIGLSGTPVAGTTYPWHIFPDGAATFPTANGGWILASNSEVPSNLGGAGAIEFRSDGTIIGARRILDGTGPNCAGGPTPWGTWLSCEESDTGRVWECDPTGNKPAVVRPALGRFMHEAAAVDPTRGHVYLTEDKSDSLLYRFTPTIKGDLSKGVLDAAAAYPGAVKWLRITDPSATSKATRLQPVLPANAPRFKRAEGMWFDSSIVYFSTTTDNRVWAYNCALKTLEVIYDAATSTALPLHQPDNVTVHRLSGDLFVAEDADNLEVVLVTAPNSTGRRVAAPFLRLTNQSRTELTGPAFNPAGKRLYVSSQRGGSQGLGITYEIAGPFRQIRTG